MLPPILANLRIPVVASPMFIVSGPELVIAQCKAGIVGIFVTIVPFIAWYLGGQAKKEIAAGAPYPFEGKIKTGYILGKVFGILQIVGIALVILIYAIMIPLLLARGNF